MLSLLLIFTLDTAKVIIGDEFRIGLSEYEQLAPKVAYGANIYLVVWQGSEYLGDGNYHNWISGAIVTRDGQIINSESFLIDSVGLHDICFGDSIFLIIGCKGNLLGFRITPEGKMLDKKGIVIDTVGGPSACTFDDENFLVAWIAEVDDGEELRAVRVTSQGEVLDKPKVLKKHWYIICWPPEVVFDGHNFLILFGLDEYSDENVYCLKINKDLQILKEYNVATDPNIWEGTSGGQTIGYGNSISYIAYCAKDAVFGVSLEDLQGKIILAKIQNGYIGGPEIAYNGSLFLVVMGYFVNTSGPGRNPVGIKGAIISGEGKKIGVIDIRSLSHYYHNGYDVKGSKGQFFVVYSRETDSTDWTSYRIFGKLIWDVEACRREVSVYPNPCFNSFNIKLIAVGDEVVEIKIYDILGRLRKTCRFQLQGLGERVLSIDISKLTSGAYFLRIERGDRKFFQKICVF